MATHRINVHPSKPLEVDSADLVIEVISDDAKLGELRVSRGSIDWVPRSHHTSFSLEWEGFDRLMQDNGRRS
ncbi:MAG: hypothetical protein ACT4OV_14115 [Microthrixaceae bacterium]